MSINPMNRFGTAMAFGFGKRQLMTSPSCTGRMGKCTGSTDYNWDGLNRGEEGAFLFQYTLSGYGMMHIEGQSCLLTPEKAFLVWIPSQHHYFPQESDHWEYMFIMMRVSGFVPSSMS